MERFVGLLSGSSELRSKGIGVVARTHDCWRTEGLGFYAFASDPQQIRGHARRMILLFFGSASRGDALLECQVSELLVNAVRHGNQNNPRKWVRVWGGFFARNAKLIVQDEGDGFRNAEDWNDFYRRRQALLPGAKVASAELGWLSYHSPRLNSGHGLCMAVPYWGGGFFALPCEAKICVLRALVGEPKCP